jgi:hypothetical protein
MQIPTFLNVMDYGMETWNCMCVSGLVDNQRNMKKKAKQPIKCVQMFPISLGTDHRQMDLKQTAKGGSWGGGLKLFCYLLM